MMNKVINKLKHHKYNIIKIILIILVIVVAIIFAYPHNLKNIIKEDAVVMVFNNEIEDGKPNTDIKEYRIKYGSQQYKSLKQILDNKYYHRNFNSFTKNDKTHLKITDYITIKCYDKNTNDTNYLMVYDKNKIMINNKSYTLGYFSNSSGKEFISEITQLVSNQ